MTHSDRNYGGSIPRYLAILVAAVLGLSLFPATAMAAHNPDGDDPCEGVPVANEYVDRSEARDVHEESIDCVIYWSIAVGSTNENGDSVYNPRNPVNRGQMSAFIYNAVENAGYDLPDPETAEDAFTDDEGSPFEGTINSLAEADIVNGTTATTYSPNANINRDQMASFMVQAANWAVGDDHPVESDGADRFTDVPESNPHKGNIEAGADAGLFSGVTATTFEPKVDVWRDQMATFLVRLFQYIWGDQAPAPTTVSATAEGRTVTGTITGADSATVSGCGLTDQAVTDEDTATDDDEIEFEFDIPESQAAGDCELTFTITRPNGQQVVRSVTVTVEGDATGGGVTDLPELVSAEVTEIDSSGSDAGITVTYTFDEIVELADENLFWIIEFDGDRYNGFSVSGANDGDNTVEVFFRNVDTGINTQGEVDNLSLATVDFGAAQDVDNENSPEGDAPLGDTDGGQTTLPAGETDGPDLIGVDVQDEIGNSDDLYEVVFTFDEEVETADQTAGAFALILEDGTEIQCEAQDATPQSTSVDAECDGANAFDPDGNAILGGTTFQPEDVSRGYAESGAAADDDGETNPLQAENAEGDNGNTDVPDLVSAEFFPGDNATDDDEVAYTFDEPVTTPTDTLFFVYDTDGNETPADSCVRDSSRVILCTFLAADEALENAVGASVEEGAVIEDSADARPNQEDEEGVDNTGTTTGAGQTDGPDLTGVTLEEETSSTGTVIGIVATYTFDEDVETLLDENDFYLYEEDGTRYQAQDCDYDTDGDEPTVECTEFDEIDENGSTVDANPDDEDVLNAVLGTVDDGAVIDDDGEVNPEGAEPVEG